MKTKSIKIKFRDKVEESVALRLSRELFDDLHRSRVVSGPMDKILQDYDYNQEEGEIFIEVEERDVLKDRVLNKVLERSFTEVYESESLFSHLVGQEFTDGENTFKVVSYDKRRREYVIDIVGTGESVIYTSKELEELIEDLKEVGKKFSQSIEELKKQLEELEEELEEGRFNSSQDKKEHIEAIEYFKRLLNSKGEKFFSDEMVEGDPTESEDAFRSYVHNLMKAAHGENYDEAITDEVVDGVIRDSEDLGEAVGKIKNSGKSFSTKGESKEFSVTDNSDLYKVDRSTIRSIIDSGLRAPKVNDLLKTFKGGNSDYTILGFINFPTRYLNSLAEYLEKEGELFKKITEEDLLNSEVVTKGDLGRIKSLINKSGRYKSLLVSRYLKSDHLSTGLYRLYKPGSSITEKPQKISGSVYDFLGDSYNGEIYSDTPKKVILSGGDAVLLDDNEVKVGFSDLTEKSFSIEDKEFSLKSNFSGGKYFQVVLNGSVNGLRKLGSESMGAYMSRVNKDNKDTISKLTSAKDQGALEYTGAHYEFDKFDDARKLAVKVAKHMNLDEVAKKDFEKSYGPLMVYSTMTPLVNKDGDIAEIIASAFVTSKGLVYGSSFSRNFSVEVGTSYKLNKDLNDSENDSNGDLHDILKGSLIEVLGHETYGSSKVKYVDKHPREVYWVLTKDLEDSIGLKGGKSFSIKGESNEYSNIKSRLRLNSLGKRGIEIFDYLVEAHKSLKEQDMPSMSLKMNIDEAEMDFEDETGLVFKEVFEKYESGKSFSYDHLESPKMPMVEVDIERGHLVLTGADDVIELDEVQMNKLHKMMLEAKKSRKFSEKIKSDYIDAYSKDGWGGVTISKDGNKVILYATPNFDGRDGVEVEFTEAKLIEFAKKILGVEGRRFSIKAEKSFSIKNPSGYKIRKDFKGDILEVFASAAGASDAPEIAGILEEVFGAISNEDAMPLLNFLEDVLPEDELSEKEALDYYSKVLK